MEVRYTPGASSAVLDGKRIRTTPPNLGVSTSFTYKDLFVKIGYVRGERGGHSYADQRWKSQVKQEIDMWEHDIEECDRKYFAEVLDYGVTESGHHWIIKRKYNLLDMDKQGYEYEDLYDEIIAPLTVKYGLLDVSYWYNWGVDGDTGEPIIYDWGI